MATRTMTDSPNKCGDDEDEEDVVAKTIHSDKDATLSEDSLMTLKKEDVGETNPEQVLKSQAHGSFWPHNHHRYGHAADAPKVNPTEPPHLFSVNPPYI